MKNLARPWIMALRMYEPGKPIEETARELGFENAAEIIKLASNENALGPSPLAVRAMRRAARSMHIYPDSGAHALRQALAQHLQVAPDQLLIANGSNEIIEFIGHVFLGPGIEMVMADRAFAIFRLIGAMFQARIVDVPMRDLTHDLEAMLAAITPATRVVFIANPNNPTGTCVAHAALDHFMARVPPHVVVVLDEAYIELLMPEEQPDSLRYVREGRRVIVLRTFSKTYGLAGLRIGYAVASSDAIELMLRIRQPFTVNAMALAAALAALQDEQHVAKTRRMVRRGLAFLKKELTRMGVPFVPSAANFMLVETGSAREVFLDLQREGVIVRPMDGYGLPRHVRVTVGKPAENRRFIAALRAVLDRRQPT